MIAALLGGFVTSPWARTSLRYGAVAFAILLFLLSICRASERAGRMAERDSYRLKQSSGRRRSPASDKGAEQNQATDVAVNPETGEISAT